MEEERKAYRILMGEIRRIRSLVLPEDMGQYNNTKL
jgi:hypothetical protein